MAAKAKLPPVDRGVRQSDGCVTIWRRPQGIGFRWLCYHMTGRRDVDAKPGCMGQIHATWGEALALLRRHERDVHHVQPEALYNPMDTFPPGKLMRPRSGPRPRKDNLKLLI